MHMGEACIVCWINQIIMVERKKAAMLELVEILKAP
jgi:hypothetical protein